MTHKGGVSIDPARLTALDPTTATTAASEYAQGARTVPRSKGLRDDDILGRLAEIETRLDAMDGGAGDAPTGRTTDAARVPERDERRDADPRNRQVMVQVESRDADQIPGMPDHMAGGHEDDNVRVVKADDRDRAERKASHEDEPTKGKK